MHSWCGLASPDHTWRCSHTQDTHSPLYTHRFRENHSAQGVRGSTSNQTPHTHKQVSAHLQKQLEVCLAIARGLRFLHTHTPPIVHRDLTDKNVMLGKDGLVKIGDLGQSRLKANNAEYFNTAQPGAIPFMPPEAMQEQSHYNEKLDIFSLGVLVLEVATQQPPRVRLVGIGRDKEIVRRREDLSKLEEDHPLKPLILSCLEDDPNERPDIVTVHTQLQAIVEGVEVSVLACMTPLMNVSVCVCTCVPAYNEILH